MGVQLVGVQLLILLLSGVGLLLSLAVVLPAPTMGLYPLTVGAPELSPWLMVVNGVAIGVIAVSSLGGSARWVALGISLLAFLLSSLPLVQVPGTGQHFATAMQRELGPTYGGKSLNGYARTRSQPLLLSQVFSGIPVSSPVRYDAHIPFAAPDAKPLTLDVYRPLQPGSYPALVVIHGGAWQAGSPQDNPEFNRYLAAQGYTVVAIAYRLAPSHRFPTQLVDVRAALAFIRQHAAEYDIDVNRMAILGRSAGAHLAMLAAYEPGAPPLRAVVNYYGPVDLAEGYRDLPNPDPIDVRRVLETFIGGPPQQWLRAYQQASPVTYVRPDLPPTLLVYGRRDHIVQARFGKHLYDRLRGAGNQAVFLEIPWAEHAFDAVFHGLGNQLALYYTERFLAWALQPGSID